MNRNLSSEDLVAYFKYLHSNAYKLYLRYLKNKTKWYFLIANDGLGI